MKEKARPKMRENRERRCSGFLEVDEITNTKRSIESKCSRYENRCREHRGIT